MPHTQLVYSSRPFGFDGAILAGILVTARTLNDRDDITGALICRADLYLQLLEGPAAAIDAAYARIARDDRHLEVTTLVRREVADRMFPRWAMFDDPARSWMWTPDEIAEGKATSASAEEVFAVFARVAAEANAAA